MATENVHIVEVDATGAAKSVKELKAEISGLRDKLVTLDKSTEDYGKVVDALVKDETKLNDVMKAGKSQVTAATGSYNDLVNQMQALKKVAKEIDVSTDEGKQKFNDLAVEIDGINDKLKEMDSQMGNHQRNVGNYASALSGLGDTLKMMPPTLGATKEKLGRLGETMQLVGKQPILGIIGLIAPILIKIVSALKENNTAMEAGKKIMESLQPIFNVLDKALEKIAKLISNVVDWFVNLAGEGNNTFSAIIGGAVGVANAIKEFLIMPIKNSIEAFKGLAQVVKDVFSGNWSAIKDDAKKAIDNIGDSIKNGFSFKKNFETGKEWASGFLSGSKEKAAEVGAEVADAVVDSFKEEMEARADELADAVLAELEEVEKAADAIEERIFAGNPDALTKLKKRYEEEKKVLEAAGRDTTELTAEYEAERTRIIEEEAAKQAEARVKKAAEAAKNSKLKGQNDLMSIGIDNGFTSQAYYDKEIELAQAYYDSIKDINDEGNEELRQQKLTALNDLLKLQQENEKRQVESDRQATQEKITNAVSYANAMASLMNTVASAWKDNIEAQVEAGEISEEEGEKQFENVKAMQYATTWINTIAGMTAALAGLFTTKSGPWDIALAATQAASILAAGVASTAQIAKTTLSSKASTSSTSIPYSTAAATPVFSDYTPEYTNLTQDSTNSIAEASSQQTVWVSVEEINKCNKGVEAKVAESRF